MIDNSLCIIPARGGSKRIAKKNIRHFCGKPIIGYVINAAIESGCFSRVIVSTDCSEIAAVSASLGAEVPFVRPSHLADDFCGTRDVVVSSITHFNDLLPLSPVACIYPTAFFLSSDLILSGFKLSNRHEFKSFVFTAAQYASPVQRSFLIDNNNKSVMLYPEKYAMRSQDLEPVYYDLGGFYIASRDCWLSGDSIFGNGVPLILDKFKAIDINTEDDWLHAEHIAKSFYPNL